MGDFIITTDNTVDLPESYFKENNIDYMKLSYIIDNQIYEGTADFDSKSFYNKIREGCMPTTSQITPDVAITFFEKYLKEGKDILHISFSSGLSGSYNSYCVAAAELAETYPERKIVVVDSLAASLGEGLYLHYAIKKKNEGKSLQEVADYLEDIKQNICHYFTVDDLNHLYRGGRVSKFSAIAGGIIGIKPILYVNEEGKLIPIGKVRGRKASLKALVDYMEKKVGNMKNEIVFISHGDSLEDAEYVKKLVEEKFGITSYIINTIGPVIGSHSGPGTIALFFMGESR